MGEQVGHMIKSQVGKQTSHDDKCKYKVESVIGSFSTNTVNKLDKVLCCSILVNNWSSWCLFEEVKYNQTSQTDEV